MPITTTKIKEMFSEQTSIADALRQRAYKDQLTGIGKTQNNLGTGAQTFEFEPVEGKDTVGDGYFFGWHTGDLGGSHNPGVAEFEDAPDALMIILTADGQMGGKRLKTGATYRVQSQFRRRYSVMAVSKPDPRDKKRAEVDPRRFVA